MLKIFGLWEEKIELDIYEDTQNDETDDLQWTVEVWQVALDVLENSKEFISRLLSTCWCKS